MLKSSSAGDVSPNRQLPETPGHVRDQRSARSAAGYQVTRRLALAGVIAPPLFVIVFLVVGFIKPGYDPVTQFVSEGEVGELGWIQIFNFLVLGLALVIFALGLWRGFGDRVSGRIGSALVGVSGVGTIGGGVFVADPGRQIITTHGALHVAVSGISFISLGIACFFFAKRFWNERWFAIYSIVTGILSLPGPPPHGPRGITQRVFIVIMVTWITILGLRLRKSSPGTSSTTTPIESGAWFKILGALFFGAGALVAFAGRVPLWGAAAGVVAVCLAWTGIRSIGRTKPWRRSGPRSGGSPGFTGTITQR